MMQSAFLDYLSSRIHYRYAGRGAQLIVAFHGYGETGDSFAFLESLVCENARLVCPDLPFHGMTSWNEERPFNTRDLDHILQAIFNSIGFNEHSFTLLGFSLGGRLALSMTEAFPQKIERLLLLAPDGMKVNFWYWLSTQTRLGNRLFLHTMKKPGYFFRMIQVANRFRLINKSVNKFLLGYIDNESIRLDLYHRWTCMRTFRPNLQKIRAMLLQRKIPIRLLYGKHDRIIRSSRSKNFNDGLQPYCQVFIIDAGHNILNRKYASIICQLLTT